MYIKSLFITAVMLGGITAVASAQSYDISEGYLRNNTFSQKYDYTRSSTGNVKAITQLTPQGWQLVENSNAHKGVMATVELGSPVTICDVAVPTKGFDGEEEGGLAAFYVSSTSKYTLLQDALLPPGEYTLVAASYNTSSQTSVTSMLKWRLKKGTVSSSLRTYPENEWVTDTIHFTVTEPTEGALWVGYSSLKTAGTVVYLDWVKLYRNTPLGAADVETKKTTLTSLITSANEALADDDSDNAKLLRNKVAEAQTLVDDANASVAALFDMIESVTEAIENYKWTRDAVITADKRYAHGATSAFARMSVSGVDASLIAEQGFAYGTNPNPTIDDNVNQATLNNNGVIYWLQDLTPATKYYMRPYVKSESGAVAYGSQTMFYTIPKGQITYTVRDGGTTEQYNRIKNATIEAVDYWNNLTSMKDVSISVGYQSGVPTADCSYGGWIRVGDNASYQATGTLLHEMLHGVGVIPWAGTQWAKFVLRSGSQNYSGGTYGSGLWLGDRATEVVQFWNNNTTDHLNGDYQHMWPFGINGAQEDTHKQELYIGNSLTIQALAEDGLETSYSHHAAPYYSKDVADGVKYYIKSESEALGRLTSYLMPGKGTTLKNVQLTAEEAQANDSAAWYVEFNPANQYYQFTNVATGDKLAYLTSSFGMSKTTTDNCNMQLMRGRVDVTASRLRGYWFIHPETSNWSPATLTATASGSVSKSGLDLANGGTGLAQRWLVLTAEELPLVDATTLGIDFAGIETTNKTSNNDVYSVGGMLVRKGNSVDGLAKGVYVVGGKKVVVR